jgi:ligand-binding sensor domain-containing protein/sensor histidine kinase YesM
LNKVEPALRRFVAVIFTLILTFGATAQQSKEYSFTHYTTETGLFSNQVNSIIQDETGFIWIATNDGLIRYDGSRYKTFRRNRKDSSSLPSNQVLQLLIDNKKNFWLLFNNGKAGRFNTRTFRFTEATVKPETELSLRANIKRLVADEYGNVFLALMGNELLAWNERLNEFSTKHSFISLRPEWKVNDIIQQPGTKKYWMGITGVGLAVYNAASKTLSYAGDNTEKEPAIEHLKDVKNVGDFMFDRKGRLWFTNWDNKYGYIYCFDFNKQEPYVEKHGFISTFKSYYEINGFHEQQDGTIWFRGFKAFGYFTDKTKKFTLIPTSDDVMETGIDYRYITCLFEDTERNVWIGTGNNGIFRINPSLHFFDNIAHMSRETGKAGDGSPLSFARDNDGSLLVGFLPDGLYRFDKNFNEVPLEIKGIREKNFVQVFEMCQSKDSNIIWFAADSGIYAYNKSERAVAHYSPPILENRPVRQVAEDKMGNLWLGMSRIGVFKWDPAKGKKKFEDGVSRFTGIPNEQIYSIKVDSKGFVWVACAITGLYVIDPMTDKVVLHFHDQAKAELKLPDQTVFALLEYSDTLMAIATTNHVLLYNRYLNKTSYITGDETLPGQISSLEKDRYGNLWISTTSAIYKVDPKTKIFIGFNRKDGIVNDFFIISASLVLPDGRMVFGASSKLVVFDPGETRIESGTPKVVVTDFKVMNRSLPVDSLMQLKQIELDHYHNSLTIDFSTLSYNNTFGVSYKLEGLDKDWKIADENNQATYSYLRPGTYKLMFNTIETEGTMNEGILSLNIKINPPAYNTWWFYSLVALIVGSFLYWLDRQRIRRMRNEQHIRMTLATNLNKDVNTTLRNINVLSEIAFMKSDKYPEQAQEYLKEIQSKSRNMVIAMDDVLSSINPENENAPKTIENTNNLSGLKDNHRSALRPRMSTEKKAARYSDKELQVFLWVIIPYTLGMNTIVFGDCIYSGLTTFAISFVVSVVYLFVVYSIFGLVAVIIQRRFPANNDLFRRVGLMLPIFYVMNVLLVTGFYKLFNFLKPVDCTPINNNVLLAIGFACLASTVITFLNEAMANWDRWKASVTETDQLKNAYQKTKLLGLKGQINPHFLFNCFNSLSSLISEDEEKAELFLDEMTKVHRYMLRGDDDQLVTLEEELRFVQSYLYLTNVRFGEAIIARIDVSDSVRQKYVPPLSLQVILENTIYTNTASKSSPLRLTITDDGKNVVIMNSVQTKLSKDASGFEEGLDNLITKYKLLHVADITVDERSAERIIILPLLEEKEVTYETV